MIFPSLQLYQVLSVEHKFLALVIFLCETVTICKYNLNVICLNITASAVMYATNYIVKNKTVVLRVSICISQGRFIFLTQATN